ncbi:MAG: hypothetical protein ABEJ69_00915 [Candidatus Nanohaloarchaea archaeon]
MRRKGLSQILWLIIAAAVMMMIALVLVFSTQNSLSNLIGSSGSTACLSTVDQRAQSYGTGDTFSTPSTCIQNGKGTAAKVIENSDTDSDEYHELICVTDNTGSWKGIEEGTSCS